jgi:4-amino-4-deoxy-L-arabinose transferase-like glycosyltransferase
LPVNSAEIEVHLRHTTPERVQAEAPIFIPEQFRSERLISALVLLASIAYLCLFRRYTTIEPDEGIILEGAQRIFNGQVLYRDFFSFFTPGSYYWAALLFKIFGNSFLVARSALTVLGGIMAAISYLLSRRVCSRQVALLVTGLMTLTALPYRFLVLHNWDSTLWASFTIYCAVRLVESRQWVWAASLGSCASLTFLFEQSKGAGLLLGLMVGFLLLHTTRPDARVLNRTNLTWVAAGLLWPVLIVAGYFATHHALEIMLADWLWPLQHYTLANRVPYGFQNWSDMDRHAIFATGSLVMRLFKVFVISPSFLVPTLPLIAIGLLIYWGLRLRHRHQVGPRGSYYVLLTGASAGLLISVLMVRPDIIHFMYLLPLLAPVLAWIIDGRDIPGRLFKAAHPIVAAYFVLAFSAFSLPLMIRARNASNEIGTRRGVITTPAKDTVTEYVQAHVGSGRSLLVYPYLPLYNYLTGTSSPTRYLYFQPGMSTTQQAQEMLADLSSKHADWVLFEVSFAEKIPNSWPGTPLSAIVKDPVADYITSSYRSCEVLSSPANWHFLFMVRKDLQCPK